MLKIILSILIPLFLFPSFSYGFADIENTDIIAQSDNGEVVLTLQFGKNQNSYFDKPIPTLQSGSLALGDRIMEIQNARVKIMGDSFVLHSEKILVYAHGSTLGDYLINCYVIGGTKLEPIKLNLVHPQDFNEEIKESPSNTELIVLIQQDIRTFWNDTYDLAVKVFDKSINPNPQFYQSFGAIDQAEITMIVKNSDGVEIQRFIGETNSKGFWDVSYFVPQNIIPGGKYIVELSVDYKGTTNFQNFETFIVADTKASDSSN